MLINITNHPLDKWTSKQCTEAKQLFGTIVDIPFPNIDPTVDEQYIASLADDYLGKILTLAGKDQITVHLMGEMTFTYALLSRLKQHGIPRVASTTQRIVEERSNGEKVVQFNFVRFRYYE